MRSVFFLAYLLLVARLGLAAPIDCAKARTPTEVTICRTPSLLQADARMDTLWTIAAELSGMGAAAEMRDAQRAFPARRERCGSNVPCLAELYRNQTKPYLKQIEHVRTFGPF